MNEKFTLYSDCEYFSPYVLSVYVTLLEKGIPFSLIPINLAAEENLSKNFATLSLTSRVPTLQNGDFSLAESSAIIEYLEETFPTPKYPSIFPSDPKLRARARQIQAWLRSDLMPIREERPTTVIYSQQSEIPFSINAQVAAAKLLAVADTLINPNQDNLFGAWSIADTDFALMLNRLVANSDPVPEKILKYVQTQWSRPSVQSWVALSSKA